MQLSDNIIQVLFKKYILFKGMLKCTSFFHKVYASHYFIIQSCSNDLI